MKTKFKVGDSVRVIDARNGDYGVFYAVGDRGKIVKVEIEDGEELYQINFMPSETVQTWEKNGYFVTEWWACAEDIEIDE